MKHHVLHNFKVLIIDDESMIRKLVRGVLTSLGFTDVTETNSGRKAIHILESQTFDFIISDWRMDDMTASKASAICGQNLWRRRSLC